jgi:hypothetical protein
MWPGRSPGAWLGSEYLGWFVDTVNSLAVAELREQPPSLHTERKDDQGPSRLLLYAPSSPFHKEDGGGGESAMLPSDGAEHGVSGELLTGDPSGRPCPVR